MIDAVITVMTALAAFVGLTAFLIGVHEFAHLWVGRLFGIKALIFSIGFGKVLWRRTDRKGTEWRISAIPLGGYVEFRGGKHEFAASPVSRFVERWFENPIKAAASKVLPRRKPKEPSFVDTDPLGEGSLAHATPFAKSMMTAAGPVSNFVLGAVLLVAAAWMNTDRMVPVVGKVLEGSPAAAAGMAPGDRILSVDGKEVSTVIGVTAAMSFSKGEADVVVDRAGNVVSMSLTPAEVVVEGPLGEPRKSKQAGFSFARKQMGTLEAAEDAVLVGWELSVASLENAWLMAKGERSTDDLLSSFGIAAFAGKAASMGVSMLVLFAGMLSIGIGIFNILPVPPLDGGRIVVYAVHSVFGRKTADVVMHSVGTAGTLAVLGLILHLNVRDILVLLGV